MSGSAPSVDYMCQAVPFQRGEDFSLLRCCCDVVIQFRSNSARLLAVLADLLPHLRGTENKQPDVTFSLNEHEFDSAANTFDFFVNNRQVTIGRAFSSPLEFVQCYMQEAIAILSREFVFVHAGVVGWNGRAIILPGKSGVGKSNLVRALINSGATYYSDEYAAIDSKIRIHPYLCPLRLKGTSGTLHSHLSCVTEPASCAPEPIRASLLVMSSYLPGGDWQPRMLSSGERFFALLRNTIAIRCEPESSMRVLNNLSSSVEGVESCRGEADYVADIILSLAS